MKPDSPDTENPSETAPTTRGAAFPSSVVHRPASGVPSPSSIAHRPPKPRRRPKAPWGCHHRQ
ncbi:MAG: hypothetical protein LBC18_06705 [Opitutaceae bacterium]|nr:hypothetical protein [Opitutaceae bacterium]